MSNNYLSGSGAGASNNSGSFVSRREVRASNVTGAMPALGSIGAERSYSSYTDFEQMLQSLHELFERDRQIASQPDSTRCGLCYLYSPVSELHYREEGLYVCQRCERALGKQNISILRKQQKL